MLNIPFVHAVYPNAGPLSQATVVFVSGANLGQMAEDVRDVVVAGRSCRNTTVWMNAQQLRCTVPPPTPLPSAMPNDPAGPVVVTTASGGPSNANVMYTFLSPCRSYTTTTACATAAPLCSWCKHSAVCLETVEVCDGGCAAGNVYIGCGELTAIVVLTALLCALIASIIWFGIRRRQHLRLKQTAMVEGSTAASTEGMLVVNYDVGAGGGAAVRASRMPTAATTGGGASRYGPSSIGGSVGEAFDRSEYGGSGDEGVNNDGDDDDDDDDEYVSDTYMLSEAYQRKQEAIEQRYRILQQNSKASLTSFL